MNELECTPAQVWDELQSEAPPRLLDVRELSEWELVHLEGGRLLDQALLDEMLGDWPKHQQIVCYCHHGVRSVQAALYLRQQGFTNVRSMKGGIDAWAREIDPSLPRY